jgi:DNA-binding NarL/FixJ family response regulator
MRVLIVDDHRLFGDALQRVLEGRGMDVVQASSGREAVREMATTPIDVALVDLGLPDTTGIELGSTLLRMNPELKVIAVTGLEDPQAVRQAMQAGFRGYLTKATPIPSFVELMKAIVDGQVIMPHRLARPLGSERSGDTEGDPSALTQHLTPREWDVLACLVEGLSSSEIAARMSISGNTLRTHIQNVLTKLQVHSRLEAAAFAVRHGLITSSRRRYA